MAAMQLWKQLGHHDQYAETAFFEEIKRASSVQMVISVQRSIITACYSAISFMMK